MTNKITVLFALFLLLTVGFGCSYIDKMSSNNASNSSGTTNPSNSSTNSTDPNATAKTGVAECDEFLDLLNNDQKKTDEDFVSRKIREYAIDFAKETIKKNIEENKGDKEKITKGCREAKEKYLKDKEKKDSNTETDKKSDTQKS